MNMKRPSNTSEVRIFWGLVTYCGKFVLDFATITEALKLYCFKRTLEIVFFD